MLLSRREALDCPEYLNASGRLNFFLINLPRCWSYNFNSIEILMAWVNLWGKKPAKNPNISETQALG